jgi:RNA polymerase sigma-70 factor (ECF subfamily)
MLRRIDVDSDQTARVFEDHRRMLTGLAYRILGSWTEAQDLVQDVWPRWETNADQVDRAEGWLRRVTVRAAIDRLRRLQGRRESYPGPWLPEPVSTLPDPAEVVADRDTISIGLLLVLETLSPLERAVFVLRQAFGLSPAEVAEVLGRTPAAVRQLDHRARQHVAERRPRYDADAATAQATTEAFLKAALNGDVNALLDVFAPDVVLHSDAGGEAKAPRRPIAGPDNVARFLAAIGTQPPAGVTTISITDINGGPGIVATGDHRAITGFSFDIGADGLITALYMMAAPSKLTHLTGPRA